MTEPEMESPVVDVELPLGSPWGEIADASQEKICH